MTTPEPTLRSSLTNAAIGAMAGAACALVFAAVAARSDFFSPEVRPYLIIAALIGAATGGILGPLLKWGPLRYISLTRAVAWTVIGTLFGGISFSFVGPSRIGPPATYVFVGAIIGALVAADQLRRRGRAS